MTLQLIVKTLFAVFENKEKIILVMEYASGGELYDYVNKFGSLPEASVLLTVVIIRRFNTKYSYIISLNLYP